MNKYIFTTFQCFDAGGIHWRADYFASGFSWREFCPLMAAEGFWPPTCLWGQQDDYFRKQLGEWWVPLEPSHPLPFPIADLWALSWHLITALFCLVWETKWQASPHFIYGDRYQKSKQANKSSKPQAQGLHMLQICVLSTDVQPCFSEGTWDL